MKKDVTHMSAHGMVNEMTERNPVLNLYSGQGFYGIIRHNVP